MSIGWSTVKAAAAEHLALDLGPLGTPLALTAVAGIRVLERAGREPLAFRALMKTHAAALSSGVDRTIVRMLKRALAAERAGTATGLGQLFDQTIDEAVREFKSSAKPRATRLIGTRILAVKPSRPGERGILIVDYNFVFPLLAGLFDLDAIADRYFIVLEPGWNGFAAPEILLFSRLRGPVFVETIEPRDRDLLTEFGAPFEPAFPLAANWWVDHRLIQPNLNVDRDIDVVMIAAWASYKRHWRFFKALGTLRRRGHRLKVALVGYAGDKSQAEVLDQARYFGVGDQIEMFDSIPLQQVSTLLSRSKLHVLWSRREGSNRAIIEAMLADVPTIVRAGFNYGHPYAHINSQTGRFVREADLADAILEMLDTRAQFSPRQWVLDHMTCQGATVRLEETVRARALAMGEPWTQGLAVKTSNLDGQEYWDRADRERFTGDYDWLASQIRP